MPGKMPMQFKSARVSLLTLTGPNGEGFCTFEVGPQRVCRFQGRGMAQFLCEAKISGRLLYIEYEVPEDPSAPLTLTDVRFYFSLDNAGRLDA